jgi:exopolysaccharide biosynthesis polyprenyl glycosylphosphotransferase
VLQRSPTIIIFTFLADLSVLLCALIVAQFLRVTIDLGPNVPNVEEFPLPITIINLVVWLMALAGRGIYSPIIPLQRLKWVSQVMSGSVIAMLVIAGMLYFSYRDVSRFLVLYFYGAGIFFLILWRIVVYIGWQRVNRNSQPIRHVVIVGMGDTSREVGAFINNHAWAGFKLVGYITQDEEQLSQPHVVGHSDHIEKIVTERHIEEVIIVLPQEAYASLYSIVNALQAHPVQIRIVPDYFSFALHRAKADSLGNIPLISLRDSALSGYQRLQKRLSDLVIAIPALIVLSPVMAIIALRVITTSHGGAIYKQRRVGENGRIFMMYKFRTMVHHADKGANPFEKQKSDPRVTPFGRFLRRTSLDELPQLVNVLKGDMSIVGPRPELPALVERYESWQRKRFAVPQGMTGWWQVNGRSDKPMYLHTEDDLYYIQNYSLWLDITIIFRTLFAVFSGRGAF